MLVVKEVFGEKSMLTFGENLSNFFRVGNIIHLNGTLGTGKTTLVRGILQGLGYQGPVKSPTYAIIECYRFAGLDVHHFDLYRVNDPEELEHIGIRDYFSKNALNFIEWASIGKSFIPKADMTIQIDFTKKGRKIRIEATFSLEALQCFSKK